MAKYAPSASNLVKKVAKTCYCLIGVPRWHACGQRLATAF